VGIAFCADTVCSSLLVGRFLPLVALAFSTLVSLVEPWTVALLHNISVLLGTWVECWFVTIVRLSPAASPLLQFELLTNGNCWGSVKNIQVNGAKHYPVYSTNYDKSGKK
jgi:hypothetical protein